MGPDFCEECLLTFVENIDKISIMTMNKTDLVERLYLREAADLSHEDVTTVVNTVISEMINVLGSGSRIEIRGFGSFSLAHRKQRMGRNPKTGGAVVIPEKYVARFKSGKDLKERVNDSFEKSSS